MLIFNEKKGYCDYPESCISETPVDVPPPVNAQPVPAPPSAYVPTTPGVVDCVGKSDGYYSNGCSPVFVYCSEGVATSMVRCRQFSPQNFTGVIQIFQKCPPTLVFNEKKGHCDYVENCSSDVPPLTPIPAKPKPAAPSPVLAPPTPTGYVFFHPWKSGKSGIVDDFIV